MAQEKPHHGAPAQRDIQQNQNLNLNLNPNQRTVQHRAALLESYQRFFSEVQAGLDEIEANKAVENEVEDLVSDLTWRSDYKLPNQFG